MTAYRSENSERPEPAYLKSYGLQEAPFSNVHQEKFIYLDSERAQRVDKLQHLLVCYSNLLLIVQGEHGIGKTSLLKHFIQTAGPDWQLCEISANTMIDAEQLLFQAAQGFGVHQLPQDANELQEMLYTRVATFHHRDQIPILLIDDAHELPRDALLAIYNLADTYVNEVNLLRIILFCEPQIEKIFSSKELSALRERVTHTMEIPPLDEEGTAEYLKHRMAAAGFNGSSPFTPRLVKKIYRSSHGIPAQINVLADEALEEGDLVSQNGPLEEHTVASFQQGRKPVKPTRYIIAGVLLLLIAVLFVGWIDNLFENSTEQVADNAEMGSRQATTEPSDASKKNDEKPQVTREIDIQEKIISLSEPATGKESSKSDAKDDKQVTEETTVNETSGENQGAPAIDTIPADTSVAISPPAIDAMHPNPVPASRDKQTISISGQGFRPDSQVQVSWTGNEKKLNADQVKVISENQIDITITVGMTEDDWSIQVINPDTGKSNSESFKVTRLDQGYQKDKWILSQNPEGFTLQLFSTNKKENADQFIEQHKLVANAGYFYTRRKGEDWYSIVYGVYPNKTAARQAAKNLPTLIRDKFWIRRFDDIQASIITSEKVAQHKKTEPLKTKPGIVKPGATTKIGKTASEYEAWLWSQDPAKFTLQLLGARQSSSIKDFLRKYSTLNEKAVYFHTHHDAHDWYTVVYGVYPDRQQAQQAIKRLPQELQNASPWIRSFGSIHAELDSAD